MSTISLAGILTELKLRSRVQTSEGFTDADLETLIIDACQSHNSSYTLSSSASTVPSKEALPVVYLAWRELCLARASRFAVDASVQGAAGIGTDRNTPYYKNMDLAAKLLERYKEICNALGLTTKAYGMKMSEIAVTEMDTGARLPVSVALPPAVPVLSGPAAVDGSGEAEISWIADVDDNFGKFVLFYVQSATALRQEWNFNSTSGYEQIQDGLSATYTSYDARLRKVKFTGLALSGNNHRFLLLHVNKAGTISYSNELVLPNT